MFKKFLSFLFRGWGETLFAALRDCRKVRTEGERAASGRDDGRAVSLAKFEIAVATRELVFLPTIVRFATVREWI
jgi:hypothetical protein